MAITNWQDPQTSEIRSTHISGLMDAVGKLEESIGMDTVAEENIPLTEVYISAEDRYRIFQAPAGKRNWLASPAPVIKKNGVVIESDYVIDYGGGAIALSVNDTEENTYTADATYVTATATSFKTHLAEYAKRITQADYVETLKRYNAFTKMQIKKELDTQWEISIYDGSKHITWAIQKVVDDYLLQTRVWTGAYTTVSQPYTSYFFNDITSKTGEWTEATTNITGYTSEVGATFDISIAVEKDGDSIAVNLFTNDRGGIWALTLDGDPSTTVNISTWSSSSSRIIQEIFSNLPQGIHVVSGEFLGDDPAHEPSTSPSRGWISSLNHYFISSNRDFISISKDTTLIEPSNKEFAFNIKPQGGEEYHFVPYHGAVTGIQAEPPIFKNNGVEFDAFGMAVGKYKELDNFLLEQHIYGRHPESEDTNLIEVWTNTGISKDGVLSIDGKMKVLQPISIINSYVIMGVVKNSNFDLCISSFGNGYDCSAEDGSYTYLTEERDYAKSYCFLSSVNKTLAVAFRYNNINDTLRIGQSDKDEPASMAYIQHRDSNVLKLYNRLWDSGDVAAGYILNFSGDYAFTVSKNLYDVISR